MGRLRFYKRNPEQFIGGVEGMSLEEIGAYTLILDHMYARGGPLPDSIPTLCGILGVDRRVWKRLRQSLILKGKIVDTGDGFLTNRRVEQELTWLEDTRQARVKAGSTGGQLSAKARAKVLENKETGQANAQPSAAAKSNQIEKKNNSIGSKEPLELFSSSTAKAVSEEPPQNVVSLRAPVQAEAALAVYTRTAEAQGWAIPRALSATRRTKLTSILRKHGAEAWREAVAIAAQDVWINDPSARNAKHENWKMGIDYLLIEANFLRLLESVTAISTGRKTANADDWAKRYEWFDTKGEWREDRGWGPSPSHPDHQGPRKLKVAQ